MKRKVYPSAPKKKVYPPRNTNHMVLWVRPGYQSQIVAEMYDQPKELCWHWIKEHKHHSDFVGGTLIAVPVVYIKKQK